MRFLLFSILVLILLNRPEAKPSASTIYLPVVRGGCVRCQISEPHPWPHATITPEASTIGEDNNGI